MDRLRFVVSGCMLASIGLVGIAEGGSLSPPGAPAPTMRSLDEISPGVTINSVPFTITQPGVYSLGRRCTCPDGFNAITVQANGVTIDLNGFDIVGSSGSLNGVYVEPAYGGTTVRNGTIRSMGGDGVSSSNARGVQLEDLVVSSCGGDGVDVAAGTLSGCRLEDNSGAGLLCTAPGGATQPLRVEVRDSCDRSSSITGNGGGGISYVGPCDASLEGVDISGNTGHGVSYVAVVSLPMQGSLYQTGGRCSSNTDDGVHIDVSGDGLLDFTVRGTLCDGNSQDGIHVSSSGTATITFEASGGSASSNGASGMKIAAKQKTWLCSNFRVNRNGGSGLSVGPDCVDSATFDQCDFSSNGGSGIDDGGGGGGGTAGSHWEMRACTVMDNALHGMSTSMRGIDKKDIRRGSVFSRNGGDGFHVVSGQAGAQCEVMCEGSTFSSNGGSGFSKLSNHQNVVMVVGFADCTLAQNVVHGIDIDDDGDGIDTILEGVATTVSSSGDDGISVTKSGTGGTVRGTFSDLRTERNAGRGMSLDGDCDDADFALQCSDSSFSSNTLDGMLVRVAGSGVQCSTTHLRCVSSGNGGNGLYIDDEDCDDLDLRVSCTGSTISSNTANGLYLECSVATTAQCDVTLDDSDLVDNGSSGLRGTINGLGNMPVRISTNFSRLSSNGDDGLHLDSSTCPDVTASVSVVGSECDDNGDDGVMLIAFLSKKGYDYYMAQSSASRNGGDGVDNDCDDFTAEQCRIDANGENGIELASSSASISSSSVSRNGADGCHCTCTQGWSGTQLRAIGNFSDGVDVSADSLVFMDSTASDNGGNGARFLHSQGVVHRDIAARNVLAGLHVQGDNTDISQCSATGQRDTSGTGISAGIRLDGSNNVVRECFVADNDCGVHVLSGSARVHGNDSGNNTNWLFGEATATVDAGPSSSAAAAASPTRNLGP